MTGRKITLAERMIAEQDRQAREAGRLMLARIADRQARETSGSEAEQARVAEYQARVARQAQP